MTDAERQRVINDLQLCVRCLESHPNKECWSNFICATCGAKSHCTAAHMDSVHQKPGDNNSDGNTAFGSIRSDNQEIKKTPALRTGSESAGLARVKNCSRTLMCEILSPETTSRVYAIFDDQSQHSFCGPQVADRFPGNATSVKYAIQTLSAEAQVVEGRELRGLKVRGMSGTESFALPPLKETHFIPQNHDELPSRQEVLQIPNVARYANLFSDPDPNVPVALLLGRDSGVLMWMETQQQVPPFVYQTWLGPVVVGEMTTNNGSAPPPIPFLTNHSREGSNETGAEDPIFQTLSEDDELELSRADRQFLTYMQDVGQSLTGHLPNDKKGPIIFKHT